MDSDHLIDGMEDELRDLRTKNAILTEHLSEAIHEKLAMEQQVDTATKTKSDLQSQLVTLKKMDNDRRGSVSSVGSVGGYSTRTDAFDESASIISGDYVAS